MRNETRWVGPFDFGGWKVGDTAFLVEKFHNTRLSHTFELRDMPPQSNVSFEHRLNGWCGTYNNLATYGRGAVKIAKIAVNGRLQIVPLEGQELADMLNESGFPELIKNGAGAAA